MYPDAIARAAEPTVPRIRIVERKCGDPVLVMQARRIKLFRDKVDAQGSPLITAAFLPGAAPPNRHVVLPHFHNTVARSVESVKCGR